MSYLTSSSTAKTVSVLVAVMMFLGVVAVPAAYAVSLSELVELFIALGVIPADKAAQARSVLGQQTPAVSSTACPYTWARNLTVGATGDDVKKLQQFLNSMSDTMVASSGAGSAGNETSTFGPATKAAVVKFQNKYASEVLTPVGLSAGTGYFGASSRVKANALCSGAAATTPTTTTPTTPVVTPAGTGLTVTKATDQPVGSLAPGGASRVPFTKIHLTASADGNVVVNGILVERQGVAADTSFTGIVLMNEDGTLIGIEKTLNSNHQVTVGGDFTVLAGTTKTIIVGANMDTATNLSGESGETPILTVMAVNTSATVHGSFPIVGTSHTVNSSLSIGSISTVARGSLDPGSSQTKEIGTTGYTFSSVKLTAGSAEDLTLKSIRWYQSESASVDDIANVKIILDGVNYDAVRDGRYYTTVFPGGGILMKKGFSKDISIKGDVTGGSARKIDFDIDRRTDVHVVGNTYGFGITPPFADSSCSTDGAAFCTTNNPYYDAAQVTISNGTMNVSSWTAGVPAQNIAVNLADQPIAGFTVDVKGEPISVASMVFDFTLTGTASALGLADVTNVILTDANGAVLAGPADGAGATANSGSITLTDTVTFPIGITNIILKAKLGTDFVTNNTVAASTTPGSTSYWTTVTGQVTGNTITPAPTSAITGATQTVKAGSFEVSVSAQPTARTIIAGARQFEFARYILDAGQSGEDIRVTSLPLYFDTNSGDRTHITNCQLYDGITASASSLTTGSNVKNPASGDTASSTSLTFDGTGLILPKGTAKTLSLRCDIKTGVTSKYWWGLDADASFTGASGVTSGQTIAEVFNEANGQVMTASANGSYTVTDDTSVLFKAAQAGATDVVLAKYRFEADSTEPVDIKGIALALGNTASNTTNDLLGQKVSIWNGSAKVGEAQFGLGANLDNATSTLTIPVRVDKSNSVTLTVKGDFAAQDINSSAGAFGAVLSVNYDGDNNGLNGNYATGADSGVTISGTSGDTAANAVKIYRGLITVSDVTTTYNPNRSLSAGSDLYSVRLTAAAGRDVTISALSFDFTVVGVHTVSGIQLFGPSGAVNATGIGTTSHRVAGVGAAGGNERVRIEFDAAAVDRVIPAGTSKDFRLRASTLTTLTSSNTETLAVALLSDTAEPKDVQGDNSFFNAAAHLGPVDALEGSASTTDRFIWSPNSTTTITAAAASDKAVDWTNSYGLPGFPSVGQDLPTQVFTH
ncbi:MAG: peptidoglycan-binding protein [Parcubacteria group bacterium]|nr:peptidoglycan-binding protein [Parcubacteria group bacterium]